MAQSIRPEPRIARPPPASSAASSAPFRDARIDVIRGLALVMIFINHVPGNAFSALTSRNFGFSDAAEAFVLLAGISAALAYGRGFHRDASPRTLWPATARVWGRAWTLYLVHIALSLAALGIVALTLRWGGISEMILMDNFHRVFTDPVGVFIGLPLMLHQFGYVNILPLYALLLLAAPFMLWIGQRWPLALLAGALALWLIAGTTRINIPSYPNAQGWFLNPFAWQLLFVLGLLTGLALKQGQRFVPVKPLLIALAAGYVGLSLLWVTVPAVRELANSGMVWLSRAGAPRIVTHFDKGHLELPRLLHVLALGYLVSVLPGFQRLAAGPALAPLALLGRQALPVFAMGTLLAFAVRGIRAAADTHAEVVPLWLDPALILGGIALQLGFAALRETTGRALRQNAPQAAQSSLSDPRSLRLAFAGKTG